MNLVEFFLLHPRRRFISSRYLASLSSCGLGDHYLMALGTFSEHDSLIFSLRNRQVSWEWSESRSVVSDSLRPRGLYSPWNSPGQNTGVGGLSLLQGIFPTQGSNPGLLHCRRILYQLSHQGSPRMLEWVAYPFSSGSSWPRNWMVVTNWAIREAREFLIEESQWFLRTL